MDFEISSQESESSKDISIYTKKSYENGSIEPTDIEESDEEWINKTEDPSYQEIIKLPNLVVHKFGDWLEDNNYSFNTSTQYVKYIDRLLKHEPPRTYISPAKIKSFLELKTNGKYQSTVRKFIEFLGDKYRIIVPNFRYTRIGKKRNSNIPLTRKEIDILIKGMPNEEPLFKFGLITETLAKTGMRISEAVGLRVKNIDFVSWIQDKSKNGRITLVYTKNNVTRHIPISPELMQKLAEECRDKENPGYTKPKDSFVFDFEYDRTIKRFKKKQRKNKRDPTIFSYDEDLWDIKYIEKSIDYYRKIIARTSKKVLGKSVNAHLFRHSYASYLDSKGVRPSIIQKLLGHKSIATTSVYLHPTEEEMAAGVVNE